MYGITAGRETDAKEKTWALGSNCNMLYQPPSFKVNARATWDLRRRTEIMPVKDSHTRI
jgi:hypothetical protein